MSDSPLYDRVSDAFTALGLALHRVPGAPVGALTVETNGLRYMVVASTDEQAQALFVFARGPEPVPAERRAVVSELFTRVNFGLATGCWLLDLDDGEVRFRASMQCAHRSPEVEDVRQVAGLAMTAFEAGWLGVVSLVEDRSPVSTVVAALLHR